jgi:RNA polymerase sigma-70 factor (ECF subfamily)
VRYDLRKKRHRSNLSTDLKKICENLTIAQFAEDMMGFMHETRHSLLFRAQRGETEAWKDLTDLYRPLILVWLKRQGVRASDVEDLSQEILLSVVKHLPSFQHSGQRGAFRSWLRTIVCSRTADYWRAIDVRTQATDGKGAAIQEIVDPESELNRVWDEEHDRYVIQCLLDLVQQNFEPLTLQAFRRLTLDGISGAQAAQELGLSIHAVYLAKSRVLQRIRQEAEGLID